MTYSENKLKEINDAYPEFNKFFNFKLKQMTKNTQKSYLNGLAKIFSILNKYDATTYSADDIEYLITHEVFEKLSGKSKNYYLTFFKKYLGYYKRKDLIELLPRYKEKDKELNKTELINRKELDIILKNVSSKKKALIIVLYEGALRRGEVIGIKYKNIKFVKDEEDEFAEVYIEESKTKMRNIPLIESIPYLQEYFNENEFTPEDLIFDYSESYLTLMFRNLTHKLKKKYQTGSDKWTKHLNPHLFRHSRLTELASLQINEPTLRKFAGWSKDSGMAKIYFHLDDTDLRNGILQQTGRKEYKKPIPKIFKPLTCKTCGTENSQQNIFCRKCGKVVNEKKVVVERLHEKERIKHLESENEKLNQEILNLKGNQKRILSEFMEISEDILRLKNYLVILKK